MDQSSGGAPNGGGIPVCAVCGGIGSCEFCPKLPGEQLDGLAEAVPSTDVVESEARARARSILWDALDQQEAAAALMKARADEITLEEELSVTAMIAVRTPESHVRYAARTLRRLLDEDPSLSLEEAASAASALAALGGNMNDQAYSTLSAMVERATRRTG